LRPTMTSANNRRRHVSAVFSAHSRHGRSRSIARLCPQRTQKNLISPGFLAFTASGSSPVERCGSLGGTVIRLPQVGQGTDLPSAVNGSDSFLPQALQRNTTSSLAVFVLGFPPWKGRSGVSARGEAEWVMLSALPSCAFLPVFRPCIVSSPAGSSLGFGHRIERGGDVSPVCGDVFFSRARDPSYLIPLSGILHAAKGIRHEYNTTQDFARREPDKGESNRGTGPRCPPHDRGA